MKDFDHIMPDGTFFLELPDRQRIAMKFSNGAMIAFEAKHGQGFSDALSEIVSSVQTLFAMVEVGIAGAGGEAGQLAALLETSGNLNEVREKVGAGALVALFGKEKAIALASATTRDFPEQAQQAQQAQGEPEKKSG